MAERALLVSGVCLPNVSIHTSSLCVYKSKDPVEHEEHIVLNTPGSGLG